MANLQRLRYPFLITIGVLLLPLISMQFSEEVQWTLSDFLIAGVLIFSVSSIISYILSISKTKKTKIVWITLLVLLFILLWAELAVGIFNSPIAGD